MSGDQKDTAREAAARAALERIDAGMTIGLGSGRAVWRVMELIAERWPDGAPVQAAVASARTEEIARERSIEVVELDGERLLDVAIDGADEVDPELGLIKGGGAALLREKLVVSAARSFVVVAETSKRVSRLGETRTLPVEVVRFAWRDTRRRLLELVADADLRVGDDGEPVLTDEGNLLLDCAVPQGDLRELADELKGTVGVVEHGLFIDVADVALLGTPEGEVEVIEP